MPKSSASNEWSDPKNIPNMGKTAKFTGNIPFTDRPQRKEQKSPYSDFFSKKPKSKSKNGKKKSTILKKGWMEEV